MLARVPDELQKFNVRVLCITKYGIDCRLCLGSYFG
jgi:hypothetical protein